MGVRAVNIQSTLTSVDVICRKADEQLLQTFVYVGESCVREARLRANFRDQTGNLRSSIGYVLVLNGKVVSQSDFASVKGGGQGAEVGEKVAKRLATRNLKNTGVTLIVVAGMNYASHVSARGYDVLDSAELLAKKIVPKMLNQLKL